MPVILFVMLCSVVRPDSFVIYIQKSFEFSYVENYDSAKTYIDKAIALDPDNPIGYYTYTGLFRLYISDFVTDSLIDSFFYYADKSIEKARQRLNKNKNDAWAHYILGGINMYISSYYVEGGNYLKALGFAEKAVNEIILSLDIEPALYDAYLAMGSYEYLKGSFPLCGGYKKKGMEKIKIASLKSKYGRFLAKNILAILYQHEGKYDDAIKEAEELVETYPESRTFRWTLCKTYFAMEDWEKTIENYEILLQNIKEHQPKNIYNIIQIELSLAEAYYHTAEYDKVKEMCNDIFERGKDDSKMKKMVKEAEKLLKKAVGGTLKFR